MGQASIESGTNGFSGARPWAWLWGFRGEKDLVSIERHTKCSGSIEKSVSQGNTAPSRC